MRSLFPIAGPDRERGADGMLSLLGGGSCVSYDAFVSLHRVKMLEYSNRLQVSVCWWMMTGRETADKENRGRCPTGKRSLEQRGYLPVGLLLPCYRGQSLAASALSDSFPSSCP